MTNVLPFHLRNRFCDHCDGSTRDASPFPTCADCKKRGHIPRQRAGDKCPACSTNGGGAPDGGHKLSLKPALKKAA